MLKETVTLISNNDSDFVFNEVNIDLKYNVERLYVVNLTESINDIFSSSDIKYIIIDVKSVDDDNKNLISSLIKINNVTSNKLIILAFGLSADCDLISSLINSGISNIINSNVLTEQKQLLKEALEGKDIKITTNISPTTTKFREQDKPQINYTQPKKAITVGLFGSMQRIGTTTQSIQIVKYLMSLGHKVCYIQMNNSDFIQQHLSFYEDTDHNENIGKIVLFNIDFYYKKEELPNIYNLKYDYIVFDYGSFENIDNTFLEKDIRICVTGTKPSEINTIYPVISKFQNDINLNYIFSFTPKNIQKQILIYMEDKQDKTYFANVSVDMFEYNGENEKIYSNIINPQIKTESKKSFIKKVMKR